MEDADVLAEEARLSVESKRRAEALRNLCVLLRKNVDIRLYFDSLPFRYVPDDSVEPAAWNRVSIEVG